MKSRFHKLYVRSTLALRQNRLAIAFVLAWLVTNGAIFTRVLGMRALSAAMVAVCISKQPGGWVGAYQSFTEVVVFGLVASVVLGNVTQKYRPEETCRAIAAQASGHVVVVGWNNFGARIWEMAVAADRLAVVVEENPELVKALIRTEDPVVIGSPRESGVLEAAGVASARVVVIATEDLESAAVACRIVRELNADCELVVRCADADVGDVLAKTYRARAISTSRLAADFIQAHAAKLKAKNVIVFGANDVGERAAAAIADKRIPVKHFPSTSDPAALAAAGVAEADLVVLCDDDLGDNLIRVDRIRDINKRTRIVCRAFHEDAAEILTKSPFDCVVLSTSRNAAESLARNGVFHNVGIDAPEIRRSKALAVAS